MRINISPSHRFAIFKRDNFTCRYCGRNRKDGVKLQVDHVHSVSAGGDNRNSNLVTACWECNIGKGKKPMEPSQVPPVQGQPSEPPTPEPEEDMIPASAFDGLNFPDASSMLCATECIQLGGQLREKVMMAVNEFMTGVKTYDRHLSATNEAYRIPSAALSLINAIARYQEHLANFDITLSVQQYDRAHTSLYKIIDNEEDEAK